MLGSADKRHRHNLGRLQPGGVPRQSVRQDWRQKGLKGAQQLAAETGTLRMSSRGRWRGRRLLKLSGLKSRFLLCSVLRAGLPWPSPPAQLPVPAAASGRSPLPYPPHAPARHARSHAPRRPRPAGPAPPQDPAAPPGLPLERLLHRGSSACLLARRGAAACRLRTPCPGRRPFQPAGRRRGAAGEAGGG